MQFKSLKSKLSFAFALIWLAAVVVGFFGYRSTHELGDSLREVTGQQLPSMQALARVRAAVLTNARMTNAASFDLATGDTAGVAAAMSSRHETMKDLETAWKDYEALPMSQGEEALWKDFTSAFSAWKPLNEATWAAIGAGNVKAVAAASDAQRPVTTALIPRLSKVIDYQMEGAKKTRLHGDEMAASSIKLLIGAIVGSGIFALLFAGWIINGVTRPVEEMTRAAAKMAEGDIRQKIEHKGEDEVGVLAESFRKLLVYVNEVAEGVHALSVGDVSREVKARSSADLLAKNFGQAQEALRGMLTESSALISAAQQGELSQRADASRFQGGYRDLVKGMNGVLEAVEKPVMETQRVLDRLASRDLTARAEGDFSGDFGRMANSLNTAVESLEGSLSQVATAAEQVASASSQIASSSQAVAQGASEQASALEETSATLVEMSGATKRNADSAGKANDLAQEAQSSSSSGQSAMGQMTDAMQKIRSSAEGTAAIIRDINEIAFQTNLLALNAAVEAARAGEAGRGFAVVAEEVRNLALRSKEAAKKTEALISESMQLSQHGEEISKDVSGALSGIVDGVSKVAGIVEEITRASQEQAMGIDQVNKAMTQMDQVTQAAAANSEESSSAAEELASQAQELTSLVGQFQITGRDPRTRVMTVASRQPISRAAARPAPRAQGKPSRSSVVPVGTARKLGSVFQRVSNATSVRPPPPMHKNGDTQRQSAEDIIPLDDDPEFRDF